MSENRRHKGLLFWRCKLSSHYCCYGNCAGGSQPIKKS